MEAEKNSPGYKATVYQNGINNNIFVKDIDGNDLMGRVSVLHLHLMHSSATSQLIQSLLSHSLPGENFSRRHFEIFSFCQENRPCLSLPIHHHSAGYILFPLGSLSLLACLF